MHARELDRAAEADSTRPRTHTLGAITRTVVFTHTQILPSSKRYQEASLDSYTTHGFHTARGTHTHTHVKSDRFATVRQSHMHMHPTLDRKHLHTAQKGPLDEHG